MRWNAAINIEYETTITKYNAILIATSNKIIVYWPLSSRFFALFPSFIWLNRPVLLLLLLHMFLYYVFIYVYVCKRKVDVMGLLLSFMMLVLLLGLNIPLCTRLAGLNHQPQLFVRVTFTQVETSFFSISNL